MMRCQYLLFSLAFSLFFALGSLAHAAVVEHTFNVGNFTVRRLCKFSVITAVNDQLPGPTIHVNEGDRLIVHVINNSPYDITIHWHGIFQRLSAWMDGPNRVTQCPIAPGRSFTYNYTISGQEGTLWWHAHASMLRATVYGALIIKPRAGKPYPFPQPYKEVPIVLGQYWKANVVDLETAFLASGVLPPISNAFTINGRPGDLYRCSNKHTFKLEVEPGRTYLLRIINAALENQLFFKVAGHTLTVIAADASYTLPYLTDVVVITPGQTVDALMVADAPPFDRYYMAAHPYLSNIVPGAADHSTTTGIVHYKWPGPVSAAPPLMPALPALNDTPSADRFFTNLSALLLLGSRTVPLLIDEHMFITFGLGVTPCAANQHLCQRLSVAASMNNISFQLPSGTSMLEAHFRGNTSGVYTTDFPDAPPVAFDYTNISLSTSPLLVTTKGTKVRKLRYGSTVEVVLQNTALVAPESHPLHLHGFNFFVVAQGFGNYNAATAPAGFNLVNPQERNTIAVPRGGWAVIRFRADNPGVWIFHCHIDSHLTAGLAVGFEVADGGTPSTTLPRPPPGFPTC